MDLPEHNKKTINVSNSDLWYFGGVFVIAFVLSYVTLSFFNLLPESMDFIGPKEFVKLELPDRAPSELVAMKDLTIPEKIEIPKIGTNSIIYNPDSLSISTMDQLLTKGAVYYPSSGRIERGNVFIFGHSTNWPIVRNQAYKTFNNFDKLSIGDEIFLTAKGNVYTYRVTSVRLTTEDEALVRFDDTTRRLTLSTCNTFGRKEERWVVEANFVK